MKIAYAYSDEDYLIVRLESDTRYCYHMMHKTDLPDYISESYEGGTSVMPQKHQEKVLAILGQQGIDVDKLPQIEKTSKALQCLWNELVISDNNMVFVDAAWYWEGIGLTQEEFEEQIDADIHKYMLEDTIAKNEDDGVLYTCYGNLQSTFSGALNDEMDDAGCNNNGILDKQAKKDLAEFFIHLGKADRETFWSTLECVGCAEEFKKYYHKNYGTAMIPCSL